MTIIELQNALERSWCIDTAYYSDRAAWSIENKAVGQCTVTAMIVYDFFGGTIIRGYSQKYNLYHFWNVVDGKKIDLTFSQFLKDKNDICFTNIVVRRKDQLLKISNVRERYTILRNRVEEELSKQP